MSMNRGRWKKGESGNPKGKAGFERILADRLYLLWEQNNFPDTPFMNVMQHHALQGITYGVIDLVDGEQIKLSTRDWLDLVKWLSVYVDGSLDFQRTFNNALKPPALLTPEHTIETNPVTPPADQQPASPLLPITFVTLD